MIGSNYHPYQFLRDSANVKDLRKLLKNGNAYIKVYSFAALNYRKENGLYEELLINLNGKTQIHTMTNDMGETWYPADLMINYISKSLTYEQRVELKSLISTKFSHLRTKFN